MANIISNRCGQVHTFFQALRCKLDMVSQCKWKIRFREQSNSMPA